MIDQWIMVEEVSQWECYSSYPHYFRKKNLINMKDEINVPKTEEN